MHSATARLAVPLVALIATLALAAPAWASTVQIQDDAHVLNATVVQNEAATLPVGVYIWATTQDAANKSTFDTDVRNKVSTTFPVVIGINTQSRHESIQIGSQARVSQTAAEAAGSDASSAFLASMQSSHDYTTAVTAALGKLRTDLPRANRGGGYGRRGYAPGAVPGHSSASPFLGIIFFVGLIAVAVLLLRRRRRRWSGSQTGPPMMGSGMPPMGSYGGYGGYGRSGMSPGAAGAMGAAGGGLLGYELGKMQGEQQQYREDSSMDRGGQYDSPDQGNWVVGQDGDFGGGSDSGSSGSSGGGDW